MVIYDTSKTEAILFLKTRWQKFNNQLLATKIKVRNEKISFNKKATK